MSVRILHASDLHLGAELSGLGRWAKERGQEKLHTLRRMVDVCEQEGIEVFLLAGDVFDHTSVEKELVREVQAMFARLSNTRVFLSPGNHDYYAVDSPYAAEGWPDSVHIFKGAMEAVDIGTAVVYGAGFTGTYQETSLFAGGSYPVDDRIHLCVVHGDLVEGRMTSVYHPIHVEDFPADFFDYIALGHVHKRSDIASVGRTHYAYSGCADGSGFDDLGEKGAYMGTVERGRVALTFRPFSSRRFYREEIDISDCDTTQKLEEYLLQWVDAQEPQAREQYYRLYLTGRLPEDRQPSVEGVQQALREQIHYIELRSAYHLALDEAALQAETSLRGFFAKELLHRRAAAEKAGDTEAAERLERALEYGLQAFRGEVRL